MPSNEEKFELIQKQYRKKFLLLQKQLEKEYSGISSKLMDKIRKVAFDFADKDGLFLKSDMDQIKLEIEAINYWFSNEMKDWLDSNIVKSADIAIQGQDNASEYFVKSLIQEAAGRDRALLIKALSDGGSGILLRAKYGTGLAKSIRKAVWNHRWEDGFTLSDRIWKTNHIMNENLKHMVEDCVNYGKSAVNFAKAVEQYLEVPGPAWTTGIKPSVTGRGSIRYNALRLARTETNNAYRKAQDLSAKESTVVKGTKWNLSGNHPEEDICDKWATQDLYKLGPGGYPPGKLPPGHPNCMCHLTSILKSNEEIARDLEKEYGTKIDIGEEKWYNKTVKDTYENAVKNEPDITKDLQEIASNTGTELVGLKYRIKTKESYLRKVKTDSISLSQEALNKVAKNTNDIIRYTYQNTVPDLVDSYEQVAAELANKGYEEIKVKNFWLDKNNPYNGINTVYKTSNNQIFEVQFHTSESFELKNGELHKLYEEFRKDDTSAERRAEITEEMFKLSSKLTIPQNIDKIKERR